MAYLSINCTFCDRKGDFHLTVDFVYSVKPPSDVGYIPDRESQPLALKSVCPTCQHPIFVLTKFKHDARKWALSSFDKDPRNPNCKHIDRSNETDLATLYFQHEHGQLNQLVDPSEIQVFPTPAPRFTHPSIPEHIAKEFRELENIMTVLEVVFNSAATQSRKILELCVKDLLVKPKNHLQTDIDKLASDNLISPKLKDWAHAIRLESNKAVHEEDSWTRIEAQELIDFVKTFMEYVYIMPNRIKELRTKTKPST